MKSETQNSASELNVFYTCDRNEWRRFLVENYKTLPEVWFVFPTKGSGEACLPYNDAVEEALCFGWIDSTNRRLDDRSCIRRFSPRKAGSPYSRPNIERLIWLEARGMIHPDVRESVLPIISAPFEFPEDILDELKRDETVWDNYGRLSEPYRRIRIAYIEAARERPEEFRKRLKSFMNKTRRNKLIIGYGGIEKYYG
ncbi:MAG: YdeI/OmpD-associated family protein [Clostridia bacterium]|nr:YdeI/OmpD-associated family protein [Clostridia bacterium]